MHILKCFNHTLFECDMIHVIVEITNYGPAACVVNFSRRIFLAQSLHFQARYFMRASSFPNDYLAYYMPYIIYCYYDGVVKMQ